MPNLAALDGPYDEQWFKERYLPLLESSEVELFTKGACHVFALELHCQFGYPLYLLPGHETGEVGHVFCIPRKHEDHAVDALGFTRLDQREWELGLFNRRAVSSDELRGFFRRDRGPGLFAHEKFYEPAQDIARRRITKLTQYFDGTVLQRTHDAPPLKGG